MRTIIETLLLVLVCGVVWAQDTVSISAETKSTYSAKCAACHGADGTGNTTVGKNLKVPDLRFQTQKLSDDEVVAIIANGAGHGRMPGFQNKLDPEMIKQLASYTRQLAGKPAIAAPTKTASSESLSQPASRPSESGPAKAQNEVAASTPVQPQPQAQPQEQRQATEPKSAVATVASKSESTTAKKNKRSQQSDHVDLNSASKETLMKLPGITEADADHIIAGRPYRSTLQFKKRKIVSQQIYTQIAGRVVAGQSAHAKQSQAASKHSE